MLQLLVTYSYHIASTTQFTVLLNAIKIATKEHTHDLTWISDISTRHVKIIILLQDN